MLDGKHRGSAKHAMAIHKPGLCALAQCATEYDINPSSFRSFVCGIKLCNGVAKQIAQNDFGTDRSPSGTSFFILDVELDYVKLWRSRLPECLYGSRV